MICRRHRAISLLLAYDPAILDFLFAPSRARLAYGARTLKRESALLGTQRHLLVKIALDIWSDSGGARLAEACHILAPHHYDAFLAAIEYLGATVALGCGCPHCRTLGASGAATKRTASRPRASARSTTTQGEAHAEATGRLRPVRG